MSVFEHVTALLSFVYALALTHLLARIADLVVAREHVKFSGLLALGMVNAILVVFTDWYSLWDFRSSMSDRNFFAELQRRNPHKVAGFYRERCH